MDEELIQQEYFCNDDVAVKGTFFSEQLHHAEQEGRIVSGIEIYPNLKVHTSWDLGSRDTNSIWFFQVVGMGDNIQYRYIHHFDHTYGDVDYYIEQLHKVQKELGFSSYGHHFLPHDVSQTEWTSGKTRLNVLMQKGLSIRTVPRLRVIERVQVARSNLKYCWFDRDRCHNGLEALAVSRAKYDESLKAFSSDEVHDWASHASAAFQYGHVGWLDCYNRPQLNKQQNYARLRH
jgi:phage terminase large subunit